MGSEVAEANDSPDAGDAGTADWFVPLQNAPAPLTTPTYEGSGQVVEPNVLFFPHAWSGHHYWMIMTPYPGGNAAYENPSILVSEDGLSWSVPEGLTNPLDLPAEGVLADPTIVHDSATNELWAYYLHEITGDGGHWEEARRMTSADGIHWSLPTQVLEGELFPAESPSVLKVRGGFGMWSVEFGDQGCSTPASRVTERLSVDGLHWAQPDDVGIGIPGYVVWHLNMTWVPGTTRLLGAIAAYPVGSSSNHTELFLAYTTDSGSWVTVPKPLLAPGPHWRLGRPLYLSVVCPLRCGARAAAPVVLGASHRYERMALGIHRGEAATSPVSWAGRRVLVTGAGGFIGSHLCEALVDAGALVTGVIRYSSRSDWGNLEHLPSEKRARLTVLSGNVEDAHFVLRTVENQEVIFHLAALITIPHSYAAPASYVRTNVEGTLNVLEAARFHRTPRVVHTSTSETFGTAQYKPIDEKHPLHAQSPYAASKIGADKVAESYHRAFGVPVATLRPFNTYGPRQSARGVIPSIVCQALAGREVRLGNVEPVRDLTYVRDHGRRTNPGDRHVRRRHRRERQRRLGLLDRNRHPGDEDPGDARHGRYHRTRRGAHAAFNE